MGELTPPPGGADGPAVPAWAAALRARCPRCGKGPLFRGWIEVRERCGACGLDLRRHDSGDGPAVALTFVLGFVVVPPALLVAMAVDWPLWLHALAWGAAVLAATAGMLRPAKAFFVAQQYRHRRSALDDDGLEDGAGKGMHR